MLRLFFKAPLLAHWKCFGKIAREFSRGSLLNQNTKPLKTLDIEKIKELVALMQEADLSEVELEEETGRVHLSRKGTEPVPALQPLGYPPMQAAGPAPSSPPLAAAAAPSDSSPDDGSIFIKSPMVGTFYRAPSPESPPYIEEGNKVKSETVVCIVEAMKVMNEIQAECSGTVVEILVENGDAIEFGQPLIKVRPS